MECSGFYFHLEPDYFMLGAGIYMFPKPHLEEYRQSVVHPKNGPALVRAINAVKSRGDYDIGVKHYKRTPRGFDPNHKNAELLLYRGMTASIDSDIPEVLSSNKLPDFCFKHFKNMLPLHKWLYQMTQRVSY